MARRSSIEKLDPRIREAVDRLIREDRATIDQVVEAIDKLGGEASRSAVGRYVKNAREQMERYRQAQQMAKVWVGKLEEDPEGDVGRLLSEMLRTVAFQVMGDLGGEDAGASPQDIMFLAKAIKDLAGADKTATDMRLRVRREVAAEAASVAEKTLTGQGMSRDSIDTIKREILGIA
ncbi:phage protein Gp27 family protein [Alkalilimnicola sp. S0819]|uniref:phage protein Gp27 family protein n=1 Tax=Alkalilimnicola sp. S0819 TaxID=2613922 RepID=UPI001261AD7B|nr:phage protein Gp27 family protein [Alkalilimnicola sp. S0819]KAB7624335.1 DUF3486 family protein [Alkalilimnicola sp. S0819]MPQ16160.1 DUF3486 family protein [Alkalilimnicola sp. S0819]